MTGLSSAPRQEVLTRRPADSERGLCWPRLAPVELGPCSRILFSCLILLSATETNPASSAEPPILPSPWQVTANKISRFVNPPTIIAEGNVILVRQGLTSLGQLVKPQGANSGGGLKPLTITGDWIRLDPTANLVKVRGHAVLDAEEEHITADLVDMDMDKQTGHLQHATLYFPKRSLYLAGGEVQKIGELSYHLENGWMTKCDPVSGKTPPWSFGWSQADITKEGFAHFSNTTFRVKDIPMAYSPYFGLSTNTKRKTGFLLPELSSGSRDGFGVLVPLFVNLSPSLDVTLYGGGLSERGPQTGAEVRYVQGEASKGTVALNALSDQHLDSVNDDFRSDGVLRTTRDRYWLRGKADHDFGSTVNAKLDLDLVSDQDYLAEYADGMSGYKESAAGFVEEFGRGFEAKSTHARTNTAQVTKLWPAMSLGGEVRTINDPSATASTGHPWSLPSLAFAGSQPLLPRKKSGHGLDALIAGTDLAWDSGYVYYWQENGAGGQRLDLHPILKAPLSLTPYLETTAAVGLRQTMYQVENNESSQNDLGSGNLSRSIADASLATSTILMRDFDMQDSYLKKMTHMIRPGLAYTYIPAVSQEDLPALDATDRIIPQNLLTYDLRNDFDVLGASGSFWKFGYARLSQALDIRELRRDPIINKPRQNFTDITVETGVQPVPRLSLTYKTNVDVHGDGADSYEMGASYDTLRGDRLRFARRYDAVALINQLNLDLSVRLATVLRAQAIVNHSLETRETSDASLRLLYEPSCWGLAVQATTTPDDAYRFTMMFSLEGIGNLIGFGQDISSSTTTNKKTP